MGVGERGLGIPREKAEPSGVRRTRIVAVALAPWTRPPDVGGRVSWATDADEPVNQ